LRVELHEIQIIYEAEITVMAEVDLDTALEGGYSEEHIDDALGCGDYEIHSQAGYASVEGVVSRERVDVVQQQAAANLIRAEAAEAELRRLGIERDEKGVFRSASKRLAPISQLWEDED